MRLPPLLQQQYTWVGSLHSLGSVLYWSVRTRVPHRGTAVHLEAFHNYRPRLCRSIRITKPVRRVPEPASSHVLRPVFPASPP